MIDHLLKVETPHGPAWHRYNGDGYGEHADGSPFDGVGIGRIWPLLTGERGHYELAAGRSDVVEKMASSIEGLANESGLIPEQIWDANEFYAGASSALFRSAIGFGDAAELGHTRNASSCVGPSFRESVRHADSYKSLRRDKKLAVSAERFDESTSLAVR